MEYSVKLARLPDGLQFPERLRERIVFDAANGRLVYKGFMTKCTYDELSALTDDPDYHRALEQLFVSTSDEAAPHPAARGWPVAILAGTIATAAVAVVLIWAMTRHHAADNSANSSGGVAVSSPPR